MIYDINTNGYLTKEEACIIGEVCKKVEQRFQLEDHIETSISFVDEQEIKELNAAYRSIDRVTDVLSFESGDLHKDLPFVHLGDIIICDTRMREQAIEYNHSVEREIAFLTLHGLLHLLGYDHITEEEERVMFALQEELLYELESEKAYTP